MADCSSYNITTYIEKRREKIKEKEIKKRKEEI